MSYPDDIAAGAPSPDDVPECWLCGGTVVLREGQEYKYGVNVCEKCGDYLFDRWAEAESRAQEEQAQELQL